jgi:hypothetical protein
VKRFHAIAIVTAGFFAAPLAAGATLVPKDLRCDGLRDPLAATSAPRFSWRADSTARGQAQSAWPTCWKTTAATGKTPAPAWIDDGRSAAGGPSIRMEPARGVRSRDEDGARFDDGKPLPSSDADPAPLLRREFTLAKPVVRARLHVAGLGFACPASMANGSPTRCSTRRGPPSTAASCSAPTM